MAMAADARSQKEVAAGAGVEEGQLSRWKNDQAMPETQSVIKLVRSLGIDGHWLLTGEGAMRPDPETDAIKLEVIGMVTNEEVDVLAIRQFAETLAARGVKRDDAAAQVETEAPVRSGGARPREPEGNDGPSGGGPPEDPSKESTNGPPNTKRHAGP